MPNGDDHDKILKACNDIKWMKDQLSTFFEMQDKKDAEQDAEIKAIKDDLYKLKTVYLQGSAILSFIILFFVVLGRLRQFGFL